MEYCKGFDHSQTQTCILTHPIRLKLDFSMIQFNAKRRMGCPDNYTKRLAHLSSVSFSVTSQWYRDIKRRIAAA